MKKTILMILAISISTVLFASGWKYNTSYTNTGTTTIHIQEPKGGIVTVSYNGKSKKDEIPTIIPLPNRDQYVDVFIQARNGKTWSQKLLVKRNNELLLRVTGNKAGNSSSSLLKGRIYNTLHKCNQSQYKYTTLNIYIMKNKNDKKSFKFYKLSYKKPETYVSMPAGVYWVEFWYTYWTASQKWSKNIKLSKSRTKLTVRKNNWSTGYGCGNKI